MAKDNNNGANLGFESELWRAADALRSNMDAAEYKHVVLGLIFLKYISDAFEEQRAKLEADRAQRADPEDPDEYRAVNIFWVPKEARWSHFKANARQPTIGKVIDDAMLAIERDNHSLKGVLPKDYAHPCLDKLIWANLEDIDRLEGFHPLSECRAQAGGGPCLYRRVLVPVWINGTVLPTWLYVVWDPLGGSPELVHIHNPVAKLDHAKREIVAARFYEIPAEAVEQASIREAGLP